MKSKFSVWMEAARLRTLPLSISGIIVGNGMAYLTGHFSSLIFLFSLLTTIAFQILSNFANDYGDGLRGTDNHNRLGPARVLQQGLLSSAELKKGIRNFVAVSLGLALILIALSFETSQWLMALCFLALGIASIVAAINYTVGTYAYGYRALGDMFVFVFFGGVSVMGSYYLQTKMWSPMLLLPAASIGLLSTAVLNLNNMRDYDNDKAFQKTTLPILLGLSKAKIYHATLILIAFLCSFLYAFFNGNSVRAFLFLIVLIPMSLHLKRVFNFSGGKEFDPELKIVALSTFFVAILFVLGFLIEG
ncbi:MAG: 1,4-dihydroxy-2-naphthoate octaprenyltransferase [Flavobacteriaceae bacterium]